MPDSSKCFEPARPRCWWATCEPGWISQRENAGSGDAGWHGVASWRARHAGGLAAGVALSGACLGVGRSTARVSAVHKGIGAAGHGCTGSPAIAAVAGLSVSARSWLAQKLLPQ